MHMAITFDAEDWSCENATLDDGTVVHFVSYGDAVPGGYNGGWLATVDGNEVGYLDYQSGGGEVGIGMVETEPEWRRRGVASALLGRLRREFPGKEIDPGMTTPEGSAWWAKAAAEDYQTGHQPGDDGPSLDYMDDPDSYYPSDVYEHPEYYVPRGPSYSDESIAVMLRVRGKPNEMVTIYRAAPPGQTTINRGDWVAITPTYARVHKESNGQPDWEIYSASVPASSVRNGGNDLVEWGYHGPPIAARTAKTANWMDDNAIIVGDGSGIVGDGSGIVGGSGNWRELEPGGWLMANDYGVSIAYDRAAMGPEMAARFDAKWPGKKFGWQRQFYQSWDFKDREGTAGSLEAAKQKATEAGQQEYDEHHAEDLARNRKLFGPTYGTPEYRPKAASLKTDIELLRPQLSAAVQEIVDEWAQDDEGFDEEFGYGGACDQAADAMASILGDHGIETASGGAEGDDHAWVVALRGEEVVGVDIPPGVYETGGGYSWTKRQDVSISPNDVDVWDIDVPAENFREAAKTLDEAIEDLADVILNAPPSNDPGPPIWSDRKPRVDPDWAKILGRVKTMYRGYGLRVTEEEYEMLTGTGRSIYDKAEYLMGLMTKRGLGKHWTTNRNEAAGFAGMVADRGELRVILWADPPRVEDVLVGEGTQGLGIQAWDDIYGEQEIPIRAGAPLHVKTIEWGKGGPRPMLRSDDGGGWEWGCSVSETKTAGKTATRPPVPVVNWRTGSDGHGGSGVVSTERGPIVAYRGFGSWGEPKDSLQRGEWISSGMFTTRGEGDTQMALDLNDVLQQSGKHRLRGTGFLGFIEADISGLPFETHRTIDVNPVDETRGSFEPDTGLGIGIVGGIPLDRIRRVVAINEDGTWNEMTVQGLRNSIDQLKEREGWEAEVKYLPETHRIVIIWKKGDDRYHHATDNQNGARCGWQLGYSTETAYVRQGDLMNRPPRGRIKNLWFGEMISALPRKPCDQCFVWARTQMVAKTALSARGPSLADIFSSVKPTLSINVVTKNQSPFGGYNYMAGGSRRAFEKMPGNLRNELKAMEREAHDKALSSDTSRVIENQGGIERIVLTGQGNTVAETLLAEKRSWDEPWRAPGKPINNGNSWVEADPHFYNAWQYASDDELMRTFVVDVAGGIYDDSQFAGLDEGVTLTIYRGISMKPGDNVASSVDRYGGVGRSWTLREETAMAIAERGQAGFSGANTLTNDVYLVQMRELTRSDTATIPTVIRAEVTLSEAGAAPYRPWSGTYLSEAEIDMPHGTDVVINGWRQAELVPVNAAEKRKAEDAWAVAQKLEGEEKYEDPRWMEGRSAGYYVHYKWGSWNNVKIQRTAEKASDRNLKEIARFYPEFDDFERAFQNGIIGRYWHITNDPNFKVGPTTTEAVFGGLGETEGFFCTPLPDQWRYYAKNRPWCVEVRLRGTPDVDYWEGAVGDGRQIYVPDPIKTVEVIGVSPYQNASAAAQRYWASLPQTAEGVAEIWMSVWPNAEVPTDYYGNPLVKAAGALSLEAVISVAEETMERAGLAGKTLYIPTGHGDDPEYKAAIAPYKEMVENLVGRKIYAFYASDFHLDEYCGGAQASTDGMNHIVVRPVTTEMTILHEVAHMRLGEREMRGHTPEFVTEVEQLYRDHIGDAAADQFMLIVGDYV